MSTSEPDAFSERGDRAEVAAYRGGGVYSGGKFAGGDVGRHDREQPDPDGTEPGDTAPGTSRTAGRGEVESDRWPC